MINPIALRKAKIVCNEVDLQADTEAVGGLMDMPIGLSRSINLNIFKI